MQSVGYALHDREGSREADISASRELFHYIVKAALMGRLWFTITKIMVNFSAYHRRDTYPVPAGSVR